MPMRRTRLQIHTLVLAAVCSLVCGCPQTPPEDLDAFIEYEMDESHIPGLAAVVFTTSEIVWAKGYGWANIEEEIPAAPETLFQLASISKTVTATAVMQLVEAGSFDLDTDIGDYLPFTIRHPRYPDTPITLRMLLTHTSGLRDNVLAYNKLYEYGADSPISLLELVEGFFTPDGQWYNSKRNFTSSAPGEGFEYSNLGFALLGLLVETEAGQPFDQYCNENIFEPLALNETSWFLRDLEEDHIAMPYRDVSVLGHVDYSPYGQYGYPDYPSGQIRTSVTQFARFYQAIMRGGELDGVRILEEDTVALMLSAQLAEETAEQCLGWIRLTGGEPAPLTGHGGGEQGVLTMAWFDSESGTGVMVFTNGDAVDFLQSRVQKRVEAITAIQTRLFSEAGTL